MRQSADVSSRTQVCMWNLCKLNITETTFTPCRTDIDPQQTPGHCNVVHENKRRSCKFTASSSNSNCFTWCDLILSDKTFSLWENAFNATEKFHYDIVRYKGIVCSHQFMEELMNGSLFIFIYDRFVCVLWEQGTKLTKLGVILTLFIGINEHNIYTT